MVQKAGATYIRTNNLLSHFSPQLERAEEAYEYDFQLFVRIMCCLLVGAHCDSNSLGGMAILFFWTKRCVDVPQQQPIGCGV
jgi:hypothetical protein